jgi:hypothetical protein
MSAGYLLRATTTRKGGAAMSARIKLALLALGAIVFAAAIGGVPWGP